MSQDHTSLSGGTSTVRIPAFRGLWQSGDGVDEDPRYAVESVNMLTREGVLRPMAECQLLPPMLPSPISTLALLYRRWHAEEDDRHEILIAASDGQLYWAYPDSTAWTRIPLPTDWPANRYLSDDWSYVTYEINPEGNAAPVDVMLLSNARDGMICIRSDDMSASIVETPKKFGVITRYAERIWGGAIQDDPDLLVYSAPYDPFNWTQNNDMPEDGAGDVMQPSWDGDSFEVLKPFGSQLMAFKRTRVWRILGTHPGEYAFKEQYGGGTAYPDTVAVDVNRILMLGPDGVLQYDGESVYPYEQQYARGVFERINQRVLHKAVACMHRGVYYCALPLDEAQDNSAVLMYNTREKTWLLRENVRVEAFLPTESALYFTSATTPGRLWLWREDCLDDGCQAAPARWITPWFHLGAHHTVKSGFTVYLTVECQQAVALMLSLQTEKGRQTKTLLFSPPVQGRLARSRRICFRMSGRRFRFLLESEDATPWRLIGGMELHAETEAD